MTELTKEQTEQMEAAWIDYTPEEAVGYRETFKAGYTAAVNRECVWNDASAGMACFYETSCGVGILRTNEIFCPNCGGKVAEGE